MMGHRKKNKDIKDNTPVIDINLEEQTNQTAHVPFLPLHQMTPYAVQSAVAVTYQHQVHPSHHFHHLLQDLALGVSVCYLLLRHHVFLRWRELDTNPICKIQEWREWKEWIPHEWHCHTSKSTADHNTHHLNLCTPTTNETKIWAF
jgi:hypothetical protein